MNTDALPCGCVWCTQGHGWTKPVSDVEYDRLAAVRA